jgi:hypothetical protein
MFPTSWWRWKSPVGKRGDVRLLIDEIPLPAATRNQRAPFPWTVTGSGKEKLGVIPDRVFALESGDKGGRILCFLEADRGTMPVERATHDGSSIARNLHAYALTWKPASTAPDSARRAFVCLPSRRVKAGAKTSAPQPPQFPAGTASFCKPKSRQLSSPRPASAPFGEARPMNW